jgi:hypothetical protein
MYDRANSAFATTVMAGFFRDYSIFAGFWYGSRGAFILNEPVKG